MDQLTLFDGKKLEKVCQGKDSYLLKAFIKKYSCLSNWINFYEKKSDMEVLKDCWAKHTQMTHPNSEDEWFNLFCLTNSPGILINTAYHCFLRNITHDGRLIHRKILSKYRRCTKVRVRTEADRRSSHEDADEEEYDEDDPTTDLTIPSCMKKHDDSDDDYYSSYCDSKKAKSERKHLLCSSQLNSSDVSDLREEEVLQMKCLQMSSPKHLPLIKECWNVITKLEYPETYDSWINFTCSTEYPYAMKNMVKKCIGAHLVLKHELLNRLFDACSGEFYPTVDKVHAELMYREYRDNISKSTLDKLCIQKDSVLLKSQLNQNRLHCATSLILNRQTQKTGLNYCYDSYSNVSVPYTKDDWRIILCTYRGKDMSKLKLEIEFCLSQIYLVEGSVSSRYNQFEDQYLRCIMGSRYYFSKQEVNKLAVVN